DAAINPNSVQIGGKWDLPANPDTPQFSDSSNISLKINNSSPPKESGKIDKKLSEALPKSNPDAIEAKKPAPQNAPHLCTCQNSLAGLLQFDPTQFGQGQCQNHAKNTNTVKSAFIIDALDSLELGSIEIDSIKNEWFQEVILEAMAASKDVPTVKEALSSTENQNWTSVIDAELDQIEKLGT
ncbi:hypothetical protein H2248_007622, partial [Termitomyces sp. 'cryptogamus']